MVVYTNILKRCVPYIHMCTYVVFQKSKLNLKVFGLSK